MAVCFWLVLNALTGESVLGLENKDTINGGVYKQLYGAQFKHMVAVKKAGSDKFELMTRTAAKKFKGAEVKEIAQPKYKFGVFYY